MIANPLRRIDQMFEECNCYLTIQSILLILTAHHGQESGPDSHVGDRDDKYAQGSLTTMCVFPRSRLPTLLGGDAYRYIYVSANDAYIARKVSFFSRRETCLETHLRVHPSVCCHARSIIIHLRPFVPRFAISWLICRTIFK